MRRLKRWTAFLGALCAAVVLNLAVLLPARADTSNARFDPIVVGDKQTVTNGSPFDIKLDFIQKDYTYNGNDISDTNINKVTISVSSMNNSILVGKDKYTYYGDGYTGSSSSVKLSDPELQWNMMNQDDLESRISDSDPTHYFNYRLTIPEKYLRRSGNDAGMLKLEVNYYNNDKKLDTRTVQKTVFDPLASASSKANEGKLAVEGFSLDHSPIKEGEKFRLTLTVRNNGNTASSHVTAALDLSGAAGVSVDGQTDTKTVGTLNAGAEAPVTFPMICVSKMVTGNYPVGVKLAGDDAADASSPKIYIPVTGTKTDKETASSAVGDSKPQIIIESYDYGGKSVVGGQEFTLKLNVKNTGSVPIGNIKMTVSSGEAESGGTESGAAAPVDTGGGVFTPAKSSNTFFIPKLGAGAVVQEQIALLPKSDAAPKSYGVGVTFQYEAVVDEKRQTLQAQETVAIPLTQTDRFEVEDVQLQNPMIMGDSGQISIQYVNKGKSKIYNLSVAVKGNFTSADANTYIGNLESGAGDTLQAAVTPSAEGTLKGTATFSYEDATGKVKTIARNFSCEVQSAQPQGPNGEGASDAEAVNGKPGAAPVNLIMILGIGGGVIVVLIALIIVLKKRKAKKLRKLEQMDDYDDEPGEEKK